MMRRPPRSTLDRSSAASDVYKRQEPPVQYTYNLTMQCQLPEAFPKKEAKDIIKYLWITDKGDAKTIALP